MSEEAFFPFTIRANRENGGGSYDLQADFLRAKPEALTWYGYDSIILSRTEVQFVAYDMFSSFRGGLGKEVARFKTLVSADATRDIIARRATQLARERRAQELALQEELVVARYADELLRGIEDSGQMLRGGD